MSLEMKEACETCQTPLASDGEAFICTFECTFCPPCTDSVHHGICPNCGGELVKRPRKKTHNR